MIIKTAEFVISNTNPERCPDSNLPEYAFIGRSNVGKSSLINMLTGRNKLAMTSATPGKTLLINHFLINRQWYLVDLPGYGYAKRSKKQQEELQRIISNYIRKRSNLTSLFVLIDSRLEPQTIDLTFIQWLGENQIPFALVFTKADKSKPLALQRNISKFLNRLSEQWEDLPPYFVSSSSNKTGREEILNYIEQINVGLNKS